MTKVNTKCFMWEILARIDRSKFERFTFEENHVGSGLYNYHFGIETGEENVYISIEAFNPMTKEDNNVCTICIKTGDGRINNAVMETIAALDNAIKDYWRYNI